MSHLLEHFSGADIFFGLPRTCTIDISYNLLENIDPKSLWSLKRVDLSHNRLESIPPYHPIELQVGNLFQGELESGKSIDCPEHILHCTSVIKGFDDDKLCHYFLMRDLK